MTGTSKTRTIKQTNKQERQSPEARTIKANARRYMSNFVCAVERNFIEEWGFLLRCNEKWTSLIESIGVVSLPLLLLLLLQYLIWTRDQATNPPSPLSTKQQTYEQRAYLSKTVAECAMQTEY